MSKKMLVGGVRREVGVGRFFFDVACETFECTCGNVVDGPYVYRPTAEGSRLVLNFCVICGEDILRLEYAMRRDAEVTNE